MKYNKRLFDTIISILMFVRILAFIVIILPFIVFIIMPMYGLFIVGRAPDFNALYMGENWDRTKIAILLMIVGLFLFSIAWFVRKKLKL